MTGKGTPQKDKLAQFRSTITLQQKRLFQEISERGELHHRYLTILEQQEAILSSIPALIYIRNNENHIVTANERFCIHFHLTVSELPLMGSDDLKGDGLEGILEEDRTLLEQNRRIVLEERVVEKENGGKSWYWVSKIPFQSADQEVLGIVCTLFDISTNKKNQLALQESENLFRTLAERSFSAIFISQNGLLKYINPLFLSLFSIDQQIPINHIEFPTLFTPSDTARLKKKCQDIENKGLFTSRFLLSTQDQGLSGPSILEVYLTQIEYQGKPAVLGSLLDITDTYLAQKALEAKALEFEILNQQLEQRIEQELQKRKQDEQLLIHQSRLAAMGEMIGAIAHQWRQPLTALSIMIQNLGNAYNFSGIDEATLKKFMDTSHIHITRMTESINQFSQFFTPEGIDPPPTGISSLLQDSILVFSHSRPDLPIQLSVSPELSKTKWKGQTNAFKQVMISLLGLTSARFSPESPQQSDIVLEVSKIEQQIRIRLQIPLVLPFGKTSVADTHRGITLDMCKKLVADHMRGRFQLIEKTGETLEFLIDLPLQ